MYSAEGNIPGDNNAAQIQIPSIVFFIVTPVFLGIRLWSRTQSRSGLGWDDWTIIISWSFAQTVSALMMASCAYGFGKHVYHLSPENKRMALKLFYVAQAFYKLTMNLTKASILLLYLRIFVQRWFRTASHALLVIILAYMVATTASSIWQCTPIARAWDKHIPGTCISITANWYANAGFSIVTDVVILALPMRPIYESRLPAGQKLALMGVFALGIFVTITSILRMQTIDFSSTSPDPTYDVASSTWTVIEENVAIICACLPMCRGLLSKLLPSVFGPGPAASNHSSRRMRDACSSPSSPPGGRRGCGGGGGAAAACWRGDSEKLVTRTTSVSGFGRSLGGRGAAGMGAHATMTMGDDDDASFEEYSLETVPSKEDRGGSRDGEGNAQGIRMVTQYEIKFDESVPGLASTC